MIIDLSFSTAAIPQQKSGLLQENQNILLAFFMILFPILRFRCLSFSISALWGITRTEKQVLTTISHSLCILHFAEVVLNMYIYYYIIIGIFRNRAIKVVFKSYGTFQGIAGGLLQCCRIVWDLMFQSMQETDDSRL